jgi:hypothetical protein
VQVKATVFQTVALNDRRCPVSNSHFTPIHTGLIRRCVDEQNKPVLPKPNEPKPVEAVSSDVIDRLIDLLGSEIERLSSDAARPGWTIWALAGALGTILWTLLSELKTGSPKWEYILPIIVLLSLSFDSIRLLLPSTQSSDVGRTGVRFQITKSLMQPSRPQIVFLVLQSLGMIAIIHLNRLGIGYFGRRAVYIVYGSLAVWGVIGMVLSFIRIPVSTTSTSKAAVYMQSFFLVAAAVGVGAIGRFLFNNQGWGATEWQNAGLVTAGLVLFQYLLASRNQPPLLSVLVGIRRKLAMGSTDYESARRDMDIAFMGLRFNDVVQEDLREVLSLWESIRNEGYVATKEMKALAQRLTEIAETKSEGPDTITEALQGSIQIHVNGAEVLFKRAMKLQKKFTGRCERIAFMAPEARQEMDAILRSVESSSKEAMASLKDLKKAIPASSPPTASSSPH